MATPLAPPPATPSSTSTGALTNYGVGLLGNAVGNAGNLGNAAGNLYNPLLQQYLTSINQNPLANLYQTGGTSNPLLEAYLNAAGINMNAVAPPAAGQPGQAPGQSAPSPGRANPVTPGGTGAVNRSAFALNGNPNAAQQALAQLNPAAVPATNANTAQQSLQNSAEGAQQNALPQGAPAAPNTVSIASNVLSPQNPYGLTQAQQTELNGQIQQYNMQSESTIQQYHQQMSEAGVDPAHAAEGAALIQQTYSQMNDQLAAQFAQQAQQAQLAALSNLISGGQAAEGQNQSDISGVLSSLQSQQNLGVNTALSGGTAALNQANVQAQQQAANQANQNSLLGSLFGSIPIIGGLFQSSGAGPAASGAIDQTAIDSAIGAL